MPLMLRSGSQTLFGNPLVCATRLRAMELPKQVRAQIEFGHEKDLFIERAA